MKSAEITRSMMRRALLLLSVLLSPVPGQATVFWEEGFENHLTPNWDVSACAAGSPDGCNPFISAAQARSGTHSLQGDYTTTDCLHPFPAYTTCGAYYDRQFPPSSEVYFRFYYRTAGFTYDATTTKHLYLANGIYYPDVVLKHEYGAGDFSMEIEGDFDACPPTNAPLDSCLYRANIATINTGDNRWFCIEGHVKYNTSGVHDGVLELWVDGTQTMRHTNLYMRGGSANNGTVGSANNSDLATMSYIRPYVQWGFGQMYYDDLAVGDTRIGCGGPPSSDTQVPSVPATLAAQAVSSSKINLTWSASSDNVGVTGYRIYRGGAQIAAVAGTSYSDTGLAASTAYTYTVAAYDAAGNASAQSVTASATTPAAATCDANNNGSTDVVDVQLSVNQALGAAACASDINQDGSCNVVDVQRVVNAALGGVCATGL